MASRILASNMLRQATSSGRRATVNTMTVRRMGGGGGAHGPQVPQGYALLGKGVLVSGFFWIMYRAKENKGQLFGLYAPWLDEHDHEHHHFAESGDEGDNMPAYEEAEHAEEEEEEEE